jgi:hypothetical protein
MTLILGRERAHDAIRKDSNHRYWPSHDSLTGRAMALK